MHNMAGKLKILFVEDVLTDAELIWREIESNKISFSKLLVDNKKDYQESLITFEPDLIISDYTLPHFNGMDALLLRNDKTPFIPFILITGSINEEVAVDCMKAGADDYILKDKLSRLGPAILNSIKKSKLAREKREAELYLHKSELRLQKAQAIAHIGNWELDLSTKTMWGSDEAIRIYGLAQDTHEIPYEIAKNIPFPVYRPILDETLDRLLKYNEPYDLEFKIKRQNDGAIRIVYSRAELAMEQDGEQVKVVGVIQDVTDRKRAEEALKKSELRFQQISEHSGEWIWEVDKDGLYTYSSPLVKKMLGYEPLEIIGKKYFYDFFMSQEKEELKKAALDVFTRKESFENFINSNIHKDGREVILSTSGIPMLDSAGSLIGYRGVDTDITERKKAEEAVNQERRMLRTLIDNLPDPIYVQDKECRKVIANKADVENIGLPTEAEVLGKTDLELFPGKIGERGYNDDKKVILSGKPIFDLEEEFISAKGIKRWLQTTKIPLYDKDGNITGLVGIGHDITERKRAEEELQQSYAFNESLLRTIPFGMDIVDEVGNVLFLSDNFKKIFEEGAVGKKCWELYRDDKKQCNDCPLTYGINIGGTEVYESHGVLGGRTFEISHTGMMYQNKKAMLEIFQDITERKENEAELIMAKEKAEESDKLKTAFLHNISHEIRTPMNAIVGFSTLLGEPDTDEKTRKSYIEVIMQSSNHLLSIITDIVDISNIEANLIKTFKNEMSVNALVKSLCNQFMPKAAEKNINLVYENGLSESDAMILTDRTKFSQILSNLISNAIKFTEKGNVKISYRLKDNFLEFSVSDTGIGVSQEHHSRIFDRFYQVQNTMEKLYEGTGLGLAISKAYVEHLGGKIWLTSEPGIGTTFFFTIPYEKQVSVIVSTSEIKPGETYVFPVKKVILVAEDVESNFKLIRYFLSGSNAEVLHAYNGKEAVEKCLSAGNIDLILMDIKMPVMDGYTAVKLIREKNAEVPIIAQTAYADDREKEMECGCSGFISKPFDRKSLFKVLSEFI
jgi:PAS domain S-box-containing protein